MEINLHRYVVRELRSRGRSAWPAIAEASGVPRSTVEKIAYEVTTNPGVGAVQALANALMNAPAPQQQAASAPSRARQFG